jgi:hypothetical protein
MRNEKCTSNFKMVEGTRTSCQQQDTYDPWVPVSADPSVRERIAYVRCSIKDRTYDSFQGRNPAGCMLVIAKTSFSLETGRFSTKGHRRRVDELNKMTRQNQHQLSDQRGVFLLFETLHLSIHKRRVPCMPRLLYSSKTKGFLPTQTRLLIRQADYFFGSESFMTQQQHASATTMLVIPSKWNTIYRRRKPTVNAILLLLFLLCFTSTTFHAQAAAAPTPEEPGEDDNGPGPSSSADSHVFWRRKEAHHRPSSVLLAQDGNLTVTLWSFPSNRGGDDPRNMALKYQRITTQEEKPQQHIPLVETWKYEFSCKTMPKLTLSMDGSTFAVACTAQDAMLYDGTLLTSKAGMVQVFRWNPTKLKANKIGKTLFGKHPKEEFGQGISMSAHGNVVAIASGSMNRRDDKRNSHQEQEGRGDGWSSNNITVYQYTITSTTTAQETNWQPLGQVLHNTTKGIMSNDGTLLATIQLDKSVHVYSYNPTSEQWHEEHIETGLSIQRGRNSNHQRVRTLSASSLALSGNGKVLALVRHSGRMGRGVSIFYRVPIRGNGSTTTTTAFQWQLEGWKDPRNKHSFIPANTKQHEHGASFGHVIALSGDGTRMAIAEPSANQGRGVVYLYEHLPSYGWQQETMGRQPFLEGLMRGSGSSHGGNNDNKKIRYLDTFGRHVWFSQDGHHVAIKSSRYSVLYQYVPLPVPAASPEEDDDRLNNPPEMKCFEQAQEDYGDNLFVWERDS